MPLLTDWVVNQTLREFGLWLKLLPSFQLSIDVMASDLSRRDCAGVLDRAMMRHGVNGTNIEIFAVYMGGPGSVSLR
jgi:sensor c-di-GMP phosphodiesterase-like protein